MEQAIRSETLGQVMRRHIGIAAYLLGAEIRFKAYCTRLYFAKRPYLVPMYAKATVCAAAMYALAGLAVVVA